MKRKSLKYFSQPLVLIIILFISQSVYAEIKTINVMAPLHVQVYNDKNKLEKEDWDNFKFQLKQMKNIGVKAITVDIWWGLVEETADNHFDWSYYLEVVETIKNADLHWIPILSFHQCGGNVGDDYEKLLPPWIWQTLIDKNEEVISQSDLTYVSEDKDESGNRKYSKEYVSLWADKYVISQYTELMNSFKEHFAAYSAVTDEINISLGPSGELRYPSYNMHDRGAYPNRGTLQCYSRLAVEDFRKKMHEKYRAIENLNNAWSINLKNFNEIFPPNNPDYFFDNNDYKNTQYGQDLTEWYNEALIRHGKKILKTAVSVFKAGSFSNIKIGFKIPGIHWQISNPQSPRMAEITAGLISSVPEYIKGGEGYKYLMANIIPKELKSKITLHFTCLEMGNKYCGDAVTDYSRAQDLVFWLSDAANDLKVTIKGENALSNTLNDGCSWSNIDYVLANSYYEGITFLRLTNVASDFPFEQLKSLTHKYSH